MIVVKVPLSTSAQPTTVFLYADPDSPTDIKWTADYTHACLMSHAGCTVIQYEAIGALKMENE